MDNHLHQAQRAAKRRRIGRFFARTIGAIFGIALAAVIGMLVVLSATEYNPGDFESVSPTGHASKALNTDEEITLLSWNIGYGALGDNADFFMDGGTGVITATKERVEQNTAAVTSEIESASPDIVLLQEVDSHSNRSSFIDQVRTVSSQAPNMESAFALNYKTLFVPYGIPPYGEINSGLCTLSSFASRSAQRLALPPAFDWPLSTMQLKRCQLVTRYPVEGTDKELVVVNEHPDAYTSKERYAAQLDEIRSFLEDEAAAGNYVVAGGDWNHTFESVDTSAYPLLPTTGWVAGVLEEDFLSPGWQYAMDNTHPTCRLLDHPLVDANGTPTTEPVQYYVIDGFIVSGNIRIVSTETQDRGFVASDHNPVVMKIVLE
ncbi:MAG: hypothetical protein IJ131_09930 [Eggerthellaceae bacterium]|nr:hypothetical protein [Eggerthellaceae bacterium]